MSGSLAWLRAASKAQPQNWFALASGKRGVQFSLVFGAGERFRVELYIDAGQRDRNLAILEALRQESAEIEKALGLSLSWEPLEGRRATRVAAYYPNPVSIESSPSELEHLSSWAADTTACRYSQDLRAVQDLWATAICADGFARSWAWPAITWYCSPRHTN